MARSIFWAMVQYRKGDQHTNMQLNPRNLLFAVCLGVAVGLTGLTAAGCKSHGDRTAGRYHDDKEVTSHVKKGLEEEPVYKFPDVQVSTFAGVVQLSGFVDTVDQKNRASEIARRTEGVNQVINSLVLKPQQAHMGTPPVVNNDNRAVVPTPTGAATGRIDATTQRPSTSHNATNTVTTPAGGTTTTTTTTTTEENK